MPVNGKSKGNSFERKIANLFSARFAELTGIEQSFRRNQDSGSFFGGSNQKRIKTHDLDHAFFGDIICPDQFNFSVECKNYKSGPTFAALVKGKVSQWDEWLAQANQDAVSSNKQLLLIIKYNGVDEVAFVSSPVLQLNLILMYKTYFCYKLKDLLTLSDSYFFSTNIGQEKL